MNRSIVVFLIDDDREDQLFFELAVSDLEIPVTCCFADDPIKGLEMLNNAEVHPDFIFIDINMPKINGMECLGRIRRMNRFNSVPVYMYSTSAEEFMTEKCTKLGAAGLIKKETSISAICNNLRSIFESKFVSH